MSVCEILLTLLENLSTTKHALSITLLIQFWAYCGYQKGMAPAGELSRTSACRILNQCLGMLQACGWTQSNLAVSIEHTILPKPTSCNSSSFEILVSRKLLRYRRQHAVRKRSHDFRRELYYNWCSDLSTLKRPSQAVPCIQRLQLSKRALCLHSRYLCLEKQNSHYHTAAAIIDSKAQVLIYAKSFSTRDSRALTCT